MRHVYKLDIRKATILLSLLVITFSCRFFDLELSGAAKCIHHNEIAVQLSPQAG